MEYWKGRQQRKKYKKKKKKKKNKKNKKDFEERALGRRRDKNSKLQEMA